MSRPKYNHLSSRGAKSGCKWHDHLHDESTANDRLGLYKYGPISLREGQRPQSYLGETVNPNSLIRRYDDKFLKARRPMTSDLTRGQDRVSQHPYKFGTVRRTGSHSAVAEKPGMLQSWIRARAGVVQSRDPTAVQPGIEPRI